MEMEFGAARSHAGMEGLTSSEMGMERTLYPYVTGTSVLGMKYKDGVILAADLGGSYGSTLRYKSVERIKPIGKHSLLGASGEISDFQEILCYLDELILYDNMWDDGNSLGPKEVHNYLNRVMYNRRNKFDPFVNSLVLGGVKNGQKYLGQVSMISTHFEDNHVATGYGNHLARPILRSEWHEDMTYEEAVRLLEKCLLVLLYRDRSAINKFQLCVKVALDFVPLENVCECERLVKKLRVLPSNRRAKEDKLEVKKIAIYALIKAVRDVEDYITKSR